MQLGLDRQSASGTIITMDVPLQQALLLMVLNAEVYVLGSPPPSKCLQQDVTYSGEQLQRFHNLNATGCRDTCVKYPQCSTWILSANGTCELLDSTTSPPMFSQGTMSGPPTCPNEKRCQCSGISFLGQQCKVAAKPPFNQIFSTSFQNCHDAVITLGMKGCKFATYRAPFCRLFKEISTASISIDATAASIALECRSEDFCKEMKASRPVNEVPLGNISTLSIDVRGRNDSNIVAEVTPTFLKARNGTNLTFVIPGINDGWSNDMILGNLTASEKFLLISDEPVQRLPKTLEPEVRTKKNNAAQTLPPPIRVTKGAVPHPEVVQALSGASSLGKFSSDSLYEKCRVECEAIAQAYCTPWSTWLTSDVPSYPFPLQFFILP